MLWNGVVGGGPRGRDPPAPARPLLRAARRRSRRLCRGSGRGWRTGRSTAACWRSARQNNVPERPTLNTVYRCFQLGRSRVETELVVDLAGILLGDPDRAMVWRQACNAVHGRASAAAVVD